MTYEVDVTAGNTPLGTILTTLGDAELREGSHFRVSENGVGAVELVLSADHAKAALIPDDCYVRIRDTRLGSYIAGGFPTAATVKLISRAKDRRQLRRFGPGSLGYLKRAIFWSTNYSTHPSATPDVFTREPGMVLWYQQPWGAILTRGVEEGRDQPGNPLGAITMTFGRSFQSGGLGDWTIIDTEGFQTPWGTNIYDLLEAFQRQGLIADMSPDLVLSASETSLATDHSGAAFGLDVVRLQVGSSPADLLANIMTDAERVWQSERTSRLLVVGADGVTNVTVTDAGAPVAKSDVYHYPESSDSTFLTQAGQAELARRALRAIGSLRLPVRLADDPLNGAYLPGPGRPLWKGNTVTIFTGSEQYDINADMKVAALDFRLTNRRGWECTAELGTPFIDREGLAERGAVTQIIKSTTPRPHSHPEILCEPTSPGTEATELHRWTWSEVGGSGDYYQTVVAEPGLGQPEFTMLNRAPGVVNTLPHYRSDASGNQIPHDGSTPRYLDCAEGVPFTVTMDVRHRLVGFGTTVTTVDAWIVWYAEADTGGTGFDTTPWLLGYSATAFTTVSETFTPPAGAGKYRIHVRAQVDTVSTTTGTATEDTNPHAGTSVYAARCDHTHPADEHDHNHDYAPYDHGHAGTTALVTDHGSMGATEEFDFSDGSDHEGTLDANLTATLIGATDGEPAWLTLKLSQDATGGRTLTLPDEVVNASDIETAFDTTANAVNVLTLFTYDGGLSWYGFLAGNGGGGGSSGRWEVVMTGSGASLEPVTNEAEDDWLYTFVAD